MAGASVMKELNHRLDDIHILKLNPFHVTSFFLYPLKTSENRRLTWGIERDR